MKNQDQLRRLLSLFTLSRKRDLALHARALVVSTADFVKVVEWCHLGLLIFNHGAHYRHADVRHLAPSPAELASFTSADARLSSAGAQEAARKLTRFFRAHQWSSAHMFSTPDLQQWHFFAFGSSHEEGAHWVGGPHIHFVNWLWPRVDPQVVWDRFVSDGRVPRSSLHIRCGDDAA